VIKSGSSGIIPISTNAVNVTAPDFIRDLDSLDARPVPGTEIASAGTANAFFSADGRPIGFRKPDGAFMRVAVSGGPPLKIMDDPGAGAFRGATWATDDTIIFAAGAHLYRVSAGGGGTSVQLTTGGDGADAPRAAAPALLPGEREVLFNRNAGGTERVAVLDLETGEEKILFEGGQNALT
jgi:hypothetical protein